LRWGLAELPAWPGFEWQSSSSQPPK
jgi:hypothetical protein